MDVLDAPSRSIFTKSTKSKNFSSLLEELIDEVSSENLLKDAAFAILSLGGRILKADAYAALEPWEARFLELFGERRMLSPQHVIENGNSADILLGVTRLGRLTFVSAIDDHSELRLLGGVEVSQAELLVVDRPARESVLPGEADAVLSGGDPATLMTILDAVEYAIDHIDPVILYVGPARFTNFEKFNNLLDRSAEKKPGYTITDLRAKSLARWSEAEKVLVASVYLLASAGVRVEEFNGQQLNLTIVDGFLRRRLAELSRLAQRPVDRLPLVELPARIGELRNAVRPALFAYREVNGLFFNKHEMYLERAAVDLSLSAMPEALAARLDRTFGVDRGRHATIDDYFAEVVGNAFAILGMPDRELTPYETIFEAIVSSAIACTASDIGMTRGLRDMRKWAAFFAQERYADVCAWPVTDYYCAVFASKPAEDVLRANGMYNKVITAIAQRMTFNSWHYTPGHVPFAAVPRDRHFYVPPRMSDLAVWSDRHHQGHVMASVRHSIRSPGGLMVNRKKQHGLFDLRLMRRDGAPFVLEDLLCARRHTAYLRAVLQASLDCQDGDPTRQVISTFTKEYYRHA